jgi:hypothetical protein
MAGRKITRLREMLSEASVAYDKALNTPDAPFAKNRMDAIQGELEQEMAFRAKFGKKPGPLPPKPDIPPPVHKTVAERANRKTVARLVGGKAVKFRTDPDLQDTAGALAAEIAVEGVKKDFAILKPGDPAPLTDEEFENARDIVSTVSAEQNSMRMITEGSVSRERWLAEAFPSLTVNRRVKCARFLHGMATMAAEKPDVKAADGCTVIENALSKAGMTYVEFANACQTDVRFSDAQAAIKAARKRCLMDRLEETLQNRALYGQMEESVDRLGQKHEALKFDNILAFNLLKYGHEQYMKQAIKDKAMGNAMTLMIAQGNYPDAPQIKGPKQAEVIDVH